MITGGLLKYLHRGTRWIYLVLAVTFSINAGAQSTLYTYQSGRWDDLDVWTTDPGGTTLTGSRLPANGDVVVVLPSRILSLVADESLTGLELVINEGATLDAGSFRFLNQLAGLSGTGTYRLSSINFPSAVLQSFTGNGGGTVEYYNSSSFNLPASLITYYNLVINCPGQTATLLTDLTINGDLVIRSGTFRINDGNPARRKLLVHGNLSVSAGASLTTGTGNTTTTTDPTATGTGGSPPFIDYYSAQSHTLELYGNLTNDGTISFTNQNWPVFNAFPADGFVSVFFRGASDKTVTCNGKTDFYNIIVDKGTDQTFMVTINSAGYDKFRLFGANNAGEFAGADAGNPNMRKALWIRNGTLRLNGYAFIPSLVEGSVSSSGDFFIPGNGALILGSPDVVVMGTIDDYSVVNKAYNVNGGTGAVNGITTEPTVTPSSISLYGKLQVNEGRLYVGEIGRIIYYGTSSAQFIINGGMIDIKQFQSVSGGGKTAFWQAAGNLVLRGRFKRNLQYGSLAALISSIGDPAYLNTARVTSGGGNPLGTDPNVGTLDIDQDDNIFHMEGGNIAIYDVTGSTGTPRAIEINSDPSNVSVTGGNITVYITTGSVLPDASYGIASKAGLYNLTIKRNSGTQSAMLLSIPAKPGVIASGNPPLKILNNLTLDNSSASGNAILNAAGLDVMAGGNIDIKANAVYTPGNNRTVLNGSGNQVFTNSGLITSGLRMFVINKMSGMATLAGNLTIRDSLLITAGTLDDGGYTLQVAGAIHNLGAHTGTGKIQLTGTANQNISAASDGSSSMGNLEIANTSGVAGSTVATLMSDLSVKSITLTSERVFFIGSHTLTVGAGGISTIPACSVTRMIRTNGFSSDGGLRRYIDNSYNGQTVLFPLGCPGGPKATAIAYFPGRIIPGTVSSPGYYTVVPVSGYHPSCDVAKTDDALDFYWKTKNSGLATSTGHCEFDYRIPIPNQYNDPYYLLSGSNAWTKDAGNNNSVTLVFPASIGVPAAEFTAGKLSPFKNPKTYYSRQSGAWNDASASAYTTWSLNGHNGVPVSLTTGLPQFYDNVVIGGINGSRNDSVTITANGVTAAIITIRSSYTSNSRSPVLNIQSTTGHSINIIRGGGKFCTSTPIIPASPTDFGDLAANDTAVFQYYGNSYTLPTSITSYPNILITGGNTKYLPGNIVVRKNLLIADKDNINNALSLNVLTGDITIYGDVKFRNGGKLIVPASATARNIKIYGNIDFTSGNTSDANAIIAESGAGVVNKLDFFGKIINSGASSLIFNPASTNKIDLFLRGSGSVKITGGTGNFSLNRLYILKNAIADTVYFKNNFSLNETQNNTASKSLTLSAGTLILSDPSNAGTSSINLNLSSGGTNYFIINSSSRLILRNGSRINITGNTSGSGIRLDGLIKAEGASEINLADGTVANTGYIEYTGSGNANIILTGSAIMKASQVRRSLSLTSGLLKYSQDGTSSATYYGMGSAGIVDPSRAKLEVAGTGSSFSMSGTSTLLIVTGGGNEFGDLWLRPGAASVTGGNIVFGTGASAQVYRLESSDPLNNVIINAASGTNEVQLMVSPLVLQGSLNINDPGSKFTTNNLNVTIGGNLVNNGSFLTGTNITSFNGSTQSISGTGDPLFWNLAVSPSVKLILSRNITIRNSLTISAGVLETTVYRVTAKGDVLNNGIYTTDLATPGVLYLNGSTLQNISGTGTFGPIELDNPAGARTANDLSLSRDLKLTNGILDISQYRLVLGANSLITGATPGLSRMIKSDGVSSNGGITKYFNAGYVGAFTFPSGVSGKYTPAVLTVDATGAGYVSIKAVNSRHPSTTSPYNVLNYYWEVETAISGFEGNLAYYYSSADVTGDESMYVAGTLVIPPGTGWSKAASGSSTDNVDETLHKIVFSFPAGTNNLGGQYTAGYSSDLPNTIPVYTSNTVLGNWDNPSSWSPVSPAGGPNGFVVVIRAGDTIRMNGNRRFSFKTTINGKLDVGTTYGHNLGNVDGAGILSLKQANLPAGNFKGFMGCSGGTLEYGGTGIYTIVADRIDTARNITFTGTGTRILPDKNLVVCNQLLINGPVLSNQYNRKLTVGGSFVLQSGGFLSGTGNNATVTFKGTAPQNLAGFRSTNPLNNIEIDNSSGLTLNSAIMMKGNLLLTNGLINTTADSLLKMTGQAGTVVGGSSSSYVNGPMSKNQLGGIDFMFPVGKGGRYGKISIINPQSGIWEAEYFNTGHADRTVVSPLVKASWTEYWSVKGESDGKSAGIKLRWDSQSDVNPLTTANGITDLRVAEYDGVDWKEKPSAPASGNDTDGSVQTSSITAINRTTHPNLYTLGSSSPVKPTITIGALSPVNRCSSTVNIPYTAVTGDPDQYMIDFVDPAFTDVSWTALPLSPVTATIPVSVIPGTYSGNVRVRVSSPVSTSVQYPFSLTILPDYIWTGAVNADWNTGGNWLCGTVPPANITVLIPVVSNKPVLSTGAGASVNNLTILAGSSLTVAGNTLKIAGVVANNGSFIASAGKIEFNGTSAQNIPAGMFSGNLIKDLTINNAAGVTLLGPLNVSGILLLQSGNLSSGGNLTLESAVTGTAAIDGSGSGQVTGNITMQRYLATGFGYKYISSPVQTATVSELSDDMNLSDPFVPLYAYDEDRTLAGVQAGPWIEYNNPANPLLPFSGYAANFGADHLPKTIDITGLANDGTFSINLTNSNNPYSTGFNLVGNPYPSAIDWSAAGWTKVNVENAIYYFSSSDTNQYTGIYSSWIGGVSSDGVASPVVPAMQGFLVHVNDGAYPVSGSLTINNNARSNNLTQHFYTKSGSGITSYSKPKQSFSNEMVRIAATFGGNSVSDPLVIYFEESATMEFDPTNDARKIFNSEKSVPSFYSLSADKVNLSINGMPFDSASIQRIPLGLHTEKEGDVIFSLKSAEGINSSRNIIFIDERAGKRTDLLSAEYRIHLAAGDYNNRFFLSFLKSEAGNDGSDHLHVYSYRGLVITDITIDPFSDGILIISSITGQTMFTENIPGNGHYEFNTRLQPGIYIVSLVTGGRRFSEKIHINGQ